MLWRRKNKRFTARVNTVVETAEQAKQSFRPRQPRVEIDMSYVQVGSEPADDGHSEADYIARSTEHSTAPATATASYSPEPAQPDLDADGAAQPLDGDPPTYEDALTELASLRELAEVFETEFDKEVAARAAVEAERDELRTLAADNARKLDEAREALATRPDAPKASDDSQLRRRIDELQAEIKREQESRLAVLAQLENTRQQVREAKSEAVALRDSASKAAAQALVATRDAEAGATPEQIATLRADFQAELTAEQSARRATEAQLDLAQRRVAAANRELEAMRAAANQVQDSVQAIGGLETELASTQAARAALARDLDEAKARIAALEQANASRRATEAETLAAALKDADAQRELAAKTKAELSAVIAGGADLDRQANEAQQRIADLERELASRSVSDTEALASALRDLETQRDIARAAKVELEIEAATRKALADKLHQSTLRITEFERDTAEREAAGDDELEAARRQVEVLQSEISRITASLSAEQAAVAAAQAATDAAEQRTLDLQRALAESETTESQALTALKQEAEAHRGRAAQIESELATEQAARSAAEIQLKQATEQVGELQRQLATVGLDSQALADARQEADALRSRTSELEAAVAAASSARSDIEAELAQTSFRLSEIQSKLAAKSETVDRLEAQIAAAASNAGGQSTDAADAARRIAELQREIDSLRETSTQAIDAAMQESATQRALNVQLKAELKGERAALDSLAEQLAEARVLAAGAQRDRENRGSRPADTNPLSSLVNAVGAIPPKAVVRPAQSTLIQPPSKVPPTARFDTLPETAETGAPADDTLSADNSATPLLACAQSLLKTPSKPNFNEDAHEGRRERRTAAQSPATVWRDGMSQALNCTIRNRSSGGALLEFPADRHGDEITEFSLGDELTLTFTSYRERSSVTCLVQRIEGRTCGVKFAGQFHVQMLKPAKPKKPLGKPELAKVGR